MHDNSNKYTQGAFCVKFTPKIRDCTPTFIINYIMIFETPRRRYPNFCALNAPWKYTHVTHKSCELEDVCY